MLRVACALVVASQLVLAAMLLDLTGLRAIVFSFVGAPLLLAAVILAALASWRGDGGPRGSDAGDGAGRSPPPGT
ncbi:MAG TPA: hypothetical protein VMW35_14460 [Myxococcota bacterium]|jgi:hypothetical protein|nr:hypothetical protein [Myxococcota bacterium]